MAEVYQCGGAIAPLRPLGPMGVGGCSGIAALVGDEGQKPLPAPRLAPEAAQLVPGADRGLLHGVLGRIPVPQQGEGQAEGGIDQITEQGIQGNRVARSSLVDDPPSRCWTYPAEYMSPAGRKSSIVAGLGVDSRHFRELHPGAG